MRCENKYEEELEKAREDVWSAARGAYGARSAAYSVAWSARNAARSARSVAWSAAYSAAESAREANDELEEQIKLTLERL